MPAKSYFSYVRVSTQRQGQQGTSLTEQTAAILHYSQRWNLPISKQYEERETAAKTGRPVFLDMLKALRQGKAQGLVVHKIDRSARNLKDWAELGSIIDSGIEVHFANESLDLNSRGGRLSADIQAVVAADFIRNLREETKKGIYGRLRDGLYPFPARVGYLDTGKGNPKEIDPVKGPLVRKAFELYSTGNYSLNALVDKMYELGLRNKSGTKISRNGLVCQLKNPFYMGLIKIAAAGEIFEGKHTPIVSKELFDATQDVFAGRSVKKKIKHFFIFRQHIYCHRCEHLLIAERQKGNAYYRCHTRDCPQATLREEIIEQQLLEVFERLKFSNEENEYIAAEVADFAKRQPQIIEAARTQLLMRSEQINARLSKLADAYMDGVLDKETYLEKKNALMIEQSGVREKLQNDLQDPNAVFEKLNKFLELSKLAYLSYKLGTDDEKQEMVKIATSNLTADGKNVSIKLKKPFQMVFERDVVPVGSPRLAASRTFSALLSQLMKYFENSSISLSPDQ